MTFKVGDRIKKSFHGTGTIINIRRGGDGLFLVQFDNSFKDGHNGYGDTSDGKKGKTGYCWFCNPTDLILIQEKEGTMKLRKGTKVRCIKYQSETPSGMNCKKSIVGATGTILSSTGTDRYKIKFDRNIGGWGDKTLGVRDGYGQTAHISCLEVIGSKSKTNRKLYIVGETDSAGIVGKKSDVIIDMKDAMEHLKELLKNSEWSNRLTLFELKPVAEANLKPIIRSIKIKTK